MRDENQMGRVKGGKVLTALSDQWRTHPQVLPCLYLTDLTFDKYETFRSDSPSCKNKPKNLLEMGNLF